MANNKKKEKAYDPYEDIKRFTENKAKYEQARESGDYVSASQYGNAGMTGYLNLLNNGYGDVAKRLGEVDSKSALGIQNEYAKKDKVELKPYLYNSKLKTEYGLSDKEIDDIVNSANGSSGFALGPINLGDPYSVVDGVEYWSPSSIDASIDQFIETQGLTPIVQEAVAEEPEKEPAKEPAEEQKNYNVYDKTGDLYNLQRTDHEDMRGKYNQLFDYALNENPFETETGKAIMDDYKLKGEKESDNAMAQGASSNGGNVDSYAQANALRQQAAMTSLGQQNALAAQSQRINDVRGILGDLGIYQSGSYEGMQKTIAIEHGINKDIAEVTGFVPFEWELRNNRYFTNGTLSNPQLDYGLIIEDIDKKLETETDPDEIARLRQHRKEASVARNYKTSPDNYGGKYAQYAKDLGGYYPTPTQSATESERRYNLDKMLTEHDINMDAMETVHGISMDKLQTEHDVSMDKKRTEHEISMEEKQTEHDINKDIAEVTGFVPFEWELRNNRYFTNGTLTNPQLDYGIIIEEIDKKLETETDPDEIARLRQQRKEASVALNYKTSPYNYDGKYAQYARDVGGYYYPSSTQSAVESERNYNLDDKKAEFGHMEALLEYDLDRTKIETSSMTDAQKQATTTLLDFLEAGAPITKTMLDAAGFTDYTPESFMAEYNANQPVKTTTTRTGGGGGGGGGGGKTLSVSQYEKVKNIIEGDDFDPENPTELYSQFNIYKTSGYDMNSLYNWIYETYGNDPNFAYVMPSIYSYFGKSSDDTSAPSPSEEPQTDYAGDGYYANTFDPATQKYNVEGLGYFTEEELTEMFMSGELDYEFVDDKIKFVKKQ